MCLKFSATWMFGPVDVQFQQVTSQMTIIVVIMAPILFL